MFRKQSLFLLSLVFCHYFVLAQEPTISDSLYINLDEVWITAHNDFVQRKSDGFLISIAGNIETQGRETSEVLKQIPFLTVSDDVLAMYGKTSVVVYIDDRKVRLEGPTLLAYLNSLPPEIIKTVEVITTPSSEYDSNDNIGIVKITTKRNIMPGWKGNIRTGYLKNTYSSFLGSTFLNYTGNKFYSEISFMFSDFSELNTSQYSSYFQTETMNVYNPRKSKYIDCELNALLGYKINEKSTVSVDLQIPIHNSNDISDIENTAMLLNPISLQVDSTIISNGVTKKNRATFNAGLTYTWDISNESVLSVNVDYLSNNIKSNRSMTSTDNYYFTNGNMTNEIFTSQVDFMFSLLGFTVNSGYKISYVNNHSEDSITQPVLLGNKYIYNEMVNALYFSCDRRLGRWTVKAGLRAEYTQHTGKSASVNNIHSDNYFKIFPSIYVMREIDDANIISLSYAERVERAHFQYLDPFRWYISTYDYTEGNPYLKPSYIKNVEVNHTYKDMFSTSLYYTRQDDKIGQMVILDSTDMMNQIQKPDNFLDCNIVGLRLYTMFKVSSWYKIMFEGDLSYIQYQSNRDEFTDLDGWSGIITMSNTFSIFENMQLFCDIEDKLPGLYDYRNMENSLNISIGASYAIKKTGVQIRMLVNDVFKTANPAYSYVSGGVNQRYTNNYDTRYFRLMLVWNFGNQFNRNRETNRSNGDEQNRL